MLIKITRFAAVAAADFQLDILTEPLAALPADFQLEKSREIREIAGPAAAPDTENAASSLDG